MNQDTREQLDFTLRLAGGHIELLAGGALAIRASAEGFASLTVGESFGVLVARCQADGCRW